MMLLLEQSLLLLLSPRKRIFENKELKNLFFRYTNLKPSFRIIEVDAETHQPVNIYQYRLDLDKWNKNTTGPIEWDLAYNFLDVPNYF